MSFDRELLDEVNQLRKDPKKYAEKINKYISYFDGDVLNLPGRKAGIRTHEGPKAYQEAVNYLSRQNPVEPLDPSKGLFRVAQDFLRRIQRKNADASSVDVDAIIDKYGTYYGDFIRATDYGGQNPEQSIINLIVSDGDRNRRQRESLLSSSYKLIGGATGTHPMFHNCTVIFTCTEFENSKDAEDIGFLDGTPYKKARTIVEAKPEPQQQTQSKYQPNLRSQPVTQSRYQPQAKEETQPQTQSKYQPIGRRRAQTETQPQAQPQTQSKYQPIGRSRAQPETQPQPQSKYQPIGRRRAQPETQAQPQTQSKYQPIGRSRAQPETQPQEQPQTQSKYQPIGRRRAQPETQPQTQTQSLTQSRYQLGRSKAQPETQPQTQTQSLAQSRYQLGRSKAQPETQPQTQTKSKYQHGRARSTVETTVETRVIPLSEYQSKWSINKEQDDANEKGLTVVSEKRSEKISIEGGKKVKQTTVVKIMSDGSKQVETFISDD
jgi:hypothetical protein